MVTAAILLQLPICDWTSTIPYSQFLGQDWNRLNERNPLIPLSMLNNIDGEIPLAGYCILTAIVRIPKQ